MLDGYRMLPDVEAIEAKRRWLAGEASEDELGSAQSQAVWSCYWAIRFTSVPRCWARRGIRGGGQLLAEDEAYAEGMTRYGSAAEATRGVLRGAVLAVCSVTYRSS